jgi:hypothetical protein
VRAVDAAILDPTFPRRMLIKFLIPESNPAFDSYRIGTVLEMVRTHACSSNPPTNRPGDWVYYTRASSNPNPISLPTPNTHAHAHTHNAP